MPAVRRLALPACLLVLLSSLTVSPARAAFPGRNGKIAFVAVDAGESHGRIEAVNPNGTGRVTLADPGEDPAWSADGRRIAYANDGIWVMNADGSDKAQLTVGNDTGPAWSPEGTRIVFNRINESGNSLIWVMNADGTQPRRVTDGYAPAWSPDGDMIVFSRLRERVLFLAEPDGSNETRLTRPSRDQYDLFADWSPDGSRIVFEQFDAASGFPGDILVIDVESGDLVRLTSNIFRDEITPVWSPDGAWIAFSGTLDPIGDDYAILTMRPDGTAKRTVAESLGRANFFSPDWQPIP